MLLTSDALRRKSKKQKQLEQNTPLQRLDADYGEPEEPDYQEPEAPDLFPQPGPDVAQEAVAMLSMVNAERRKTGAAPLCLNAKLNQAAMKHSQNKRRCRRVTGPHAGCDGSTLSYRLVREGYRWKETNGPYGSPGRPLYAENVFKGQRDGAAVMRVWMSSRIERKNILNRLFTNFGYGKDGPYHTQVFGTLWRSGPTSVGVGCTFGPGPVALADEGSDDVALADEGSDDMAEGGRQRRRGRPFR